MKASPDMPTSNERERGVNSDLLAMIDIDRCMLNSDYFFGLVMEQLNKAGVADEVVQAVQSAETQEKGNAFDYLAQVRALSDTIEISPEILAQSILSSYDIAALGQAIFADGAVEFLQALQRSDAHMMFVTAGGEQTQRLKLVVIAALLEPLLSTSAHIPWIIIDDSQQRKTQLAAEVYDSASQRFDMRSLLSYAKASHGLEDVDELTGITNVLVVDDKTQNVTDTGVTGVQGVLVVRAERPHDTQDSLASTLPDVTQMIEARHHNI